MLVFKGQHAKGGPLHVIRVEAPEGAPMDTKTRIREGVKQAVLDTLAPKEIKYDYVGVGEVFGILGDGLPLVTVDLRLGRDAGRKKALSDAIATLLQQELNSDPADLYVLFRENPAENHCTGGTPLADWVPADQ